MALLNALDCTVKGKGNTGFGACVVNKGRTIGFILIPRGTEIAYTDLASLKTAITAGINANDPNARYYPVLNIVPTADNTEDISIQTYPDGTKVVTAEGKADYTFAILKGKFCLQTRLRRHNNINEDVLEIDEFGNLWGVEGSTPDKIKGITPSIAWAQAVRPSQGTDAETQYLYRLSYDQAQINDTPAIVPFNKDSFLRTLFGLQDVALSKVARSVNVLTVSAKTACGTVNMYDQYSSALAIVGAWKATTPAGADLTISGVTAVANTKSWAITISTADPDYVVSQDILVSLAGPTDLKALNVVGFESDVVTVGV